MGCSSPGHSRSVILRLLTSQIRSRRNKNSKRLISASLKLMTLNLSNLEGCVNRLVQSNRGMEVRSCSTATEALGFELGLRSLC